MSQRRFRPALDGLASYVAGRSEEAVRRERQVNGPLVKLASNEGQFGPFPSALEAIERELPRTYRYPEAGFGTLRMALARRHGIATDQVLVAAGGCALVHHLAGALLEPGDEVLHGSPTFTAYRLEAIRAGATPVAAPLTENGAFDLDAMLERVTARTKLVYLTNPNNPTGGMFGKAALDAFLEALPEQVLPVLDEAYTEYVDDPDYPDGIREYAARGQQVVVMRTFSKIYGLAGLRVAFAVAPADVVAACAKVQNPFEVNRLGLVAALASLDDADELDRRRVSNAEGRQQLFDGLRALGADVLPSVGNFVYVRVGDGQATAAALEERGYIVRPLGSMGDPAGIRVTVGLPDENAGFLEAFAAIQ